MQCRRIAVWLAWIGVISFLVAFPPPCRASAGAVTLIVGGDVLLDRGVRRSIEAAGDSMAPFTGIRPVLSRVDIALANLECALSDSGTLLTKVFMFRSGSRMAAVLRRAGFTAMNLANNHAYDCGRSGLEETELKLRRAGILPIGMGRNEEDALRPVIVRVNGMRVAVLGFVDMLLEGLMPLPDRPTPAQADPANVVDAIRRARSVADRVVVTIHWGEEYAPFPTDEQRMLARRMIAAGADVIVGHHPHVIESVERIGRGFVFYSVGNLVFDQTLPACAEGLLVRARFVTGDGSGDSFSVLPVRIEASRPAPAGVDDAREILRRLEASSDSVTFQVQQDGWWGIESP